MNSNVVQQMSSFTNDGENFAISETPSRQSPASLALWFERWNPNTPQPTSENWWRQGVLGSSLSPSNSHVFIQWKQQLLEQEMEIGNPIASLRQSYVLSDPEGLSDFLKRYRALPSLLQDMTKPIKKFFGQDCVLTLALDRSGDESPIIRLAILWKDSLSAASAALNAFDEHYWINNCGRSSGNIVVNYDLV